MSASDRPSANPVARPAEGGAASERVARDDAFDHAKGLLVAAMVVYHVLNTCSTADAEAYRYIRFVSGSFIFVTGLIAARFIAPAFTRDAGAATVRLVFRGLKIVALFTVLNLAIHLSGIGNTAKRQLGAAGFAAHAYEVYVLGRNDVASFVILLPIGYLLMVMPLVLRFAGPAQPRATMVAITLTALLAVALTWHPLSFVADFMVVGLAGISLGATSWFLPQAPDRSRSSSGMSVLGLAATVVLAGLFGTTLIAYVVGVAVILRFLLALSQSLPAPGKPGAALVLLGRYSLFAYVAQIAIIQAFARATNHRQWAPGFELAGIMAGTALLLVLLCQGVDRLRGRSAHADRAYRFVFG